jgi:phosphate transport system substrate-binding protein
MLAFARSAAAEVEIVGSSTILPMVKKATSSLEAHLGLKINPQGGGSGAGVAAVRGNNAEIGMVSRALTAEEKAEFDATLIGYDGVAFIVHVKNHLNELNRAQARAIFSGEAKNWREFTELDRPILTIIKAKGRSTRDLVDEFLGLPEQVHAAFSVAGSNTEVILRVASDPLAIGYVSIGSAEKAHLKGLPIKLLTLDETPASIYEVVNGNYAFSRELNLITRRPPSPLARRVLKFFTSPEGQKFVEGEGFAPISNKAKER